MIEEFFQKLYTDVMKIVSTLEIKRDDLAKVSETADTIVAFERYLSAIKGDTNFYNYYEYDDDILRKVLPDLVYYNAKEDISTVPEQYRLELVLEQNKRNIETFEEKNNYYRQYLGLPDIEDKNYIYVTEIEEIKNTPIHQLSNSNIVMITRKGILDKIQNQYPNKKYLFFLGSEKIDLIKLRLAKNFDIIKYSESVDETVITSFMKEYYFAKTYMMRVMYYPKVYGDTELYHASFGMLILCLAIRNTLSPDNYVYMNSEDILNNMLQSYDLYEVFKYLPFIYKKRLILAIDRILANKGTDKIVSTICQIFSYNSIIVNRYYIFKDHKKNDDGTFKFPKKPSGEIDYNNQYNLKFSKVNADDIRRLQDDTKETIDEVVINDPLWQLTDKDMENVKKTEFTSIMSEYLSIDTIFEMNEMIFEISYFLNMLIDIRESTSKIYAFNMYSSSGKSDCFTMLMFIFTILCKRLGYDGNIIYDPVHIAEIYKFNLLEIEEAIADIITTHKLDISVSEVLLNRPNSDMNSKEVVNMYKANKSFYKSLMSEMRNTKEYDKYIGLYEIYKILYISSIQESSFVKSDNTTALTYSEMLYDLDSDLYELVMNTESDNTLDNMLVYALEKMENIFNDPELKFLFTNIPNVGSDLISIYLKQMLEIFKESSTVILQINKIFNISDESPIILNKPTRLFDTTKLDCDISRNEIIYTYDSAKTNMEITISDITYADDKILI